MRRTPQRQQKQTEGKKSPELEHPSSVDHSDHSWILEPLAVSCQMQSHLQPPSIHQNLPGWSTNIRNICHPSLYPFSTLPAPDGGNPMGIEMDGPSQGPSSSTAAPLSAHYHHRGRERKRPTASGTAARNSEHEGVHKCSYCSRTFTTSQSAHRHEVSHTDNKKPYECDICHQRFTQHYTMVLHKRRLHEGANLGGRQASGIGSQLRPELQCSDCSDTFKTFVLLQAHILQTHKTRLQELRNDLTQVVTAAACKICPMPFPRGSDAKEHKKRHAKWYETNKSGQPFPLLKITPEVCAIFKRLPALSRGKYLKMFDPTMELHHCHLCGQDCTTQSLLTIHMKKVHSDIYKDRLHRCEHCSKYFLDASSLRQHLENHVNVKRYSSRYCSRAFQHYRSALRHDKIHERLGICQRTYRKNDKTVYVARNCGLCGENCSNASNFVQHFLQTHQRSLSIKVTRFQVKPVSDSYPEFGNGTYGTTALCATCGNSFKAKDFKLHLAISPTTCGNVQHHQPQSYETESDEAESENDKREIVGAGAHDSLKDIDNQLDSDNNWDSLSVSEPLLASTKSSRLPLGEDENAFGQDLVDRASAGEHHPEMRNVEARNGLDKLEDEVETPNLIPGVVIKTEFSEIQIEPFCWNQETEDADIDEHTPVPDPDPDPSTQWWKETNDGRGRKLQCTICHQEFGPRPSRIWYAKKNHFANHHGTKETLQCPHCPTRLTSRYTLAQHVRRHTGEKPYECDICHANFSSLPSIFMHKKDKHSGKTYQCTICGKISSYYSRHLAHMKAHRENPDQEADQASRQCQQCGKEFVHAARLHSHLVNVHGTNAKEISDRYRRRQHACEKCPKIFTSLTSLKRHHIVEHPINGLAPKFFQCKLCDRGFALVSSIRSHLRSMHSHQLWPPDLLIQNSSVTDSRSGSPSLNSNPPHGPGGSNADTFPKTLNTESISTIPVETKTYSLENYFVRNKWSKFRQ